VAICRLVTSHGLQPHTLSKLSVSKVHALAPPSKPDRN